MRDRKGAVSEICRLMEEEVQSMVLDRLHEFEQIDQLVQCLQGKSKQDFSKFFNAGNLVLNDLVVASKVREWTRDKLAIQLSVQGLYLQEELLLLWDLLELTTAGLSYEKSAFQNAVGLVVKVRNVGGESHAKKVLDYDVYNDGLWIDFCNAVMEIEGVLQCPELRSLVDRYSIKLSKIPGNVPAPFYEQQGSGRFYGRFTELTKLKKKIRTKRSRGVEITGRGGLGKTALAIKLVHELGPSDFSSVVWFSAKTDVMTASGVEDVKLSHYGLHSVLSAIATVLIDDGHEDDFGPGFWGLGELHAAVSAELEKPGSNVLIVVDNWETIESVFGAVGYQRLKGAIEDEEHEFFLDATWLITSRVSTGLDGMSEVPLPKMDEVSAHSMLRDHAQHSERISGSLKSWFNKKENRQRAVDYCDCYPLFMRVFCGWLENGMELDDALNRRSDERYELEEFCFRRSLDSLIHVHSLWIIYFLDQCSKTGVRNIRYHDVVDSLGLSQEEWVVAKRELLDYCIILDYEEGIVIAPAMSGFVRRSVRIEDGEFLRRCNKSVGDLKKKRAVREDRCGVSWRRGMLPTVQAALGVMEGGRKRPESFAIGIGSLADSPYKVQLNWLSDLVNGDARLEELREIEVESFDFHGGYFGIIEQILGKLIERQLDVEGKLSLMLLERLKGEFFDCNPWYYRYVLQRIHMAVHGAGSAELEIILQEVQNRQPNSYRYFLQAAWKKIFGGQVEMTSGLIELFGKNLEEMMGYRWKVDLVWSQKMNKLIPDSCRILWGDWLDWCAESGFGDSGDFYTLLQHNR